MAHPTAVINIVGLSESLIGPHAPNIQALAGRGTLRRLAPVLPAVTCSVQSSMLTGLAVREHGIVGNGWYDRERAEIGFWKQSNRLVKGEKVWETARERDPSVTCANMFWWFNMYSSAEYAVTPRPIYAADGRKFPDVYTEPPELRDRLQDDIGRFPLFNFWGPASSIASSRWIAAASIAVHRQHRPTLTLVYLPHLDYALQKLGPDSPEIPAAVAEIDAVVGDLVAHFDREGVRIIVLSEYGIEPVNRAMSVNRLLRREGWLRVREERGGELLDAGASDAFAAVDHQVAHVYVRDPGRIADCAALLAGHDDVDLVLDREAQHEHGIDHDRAGDLVIVATRGRWFSYDYWLDEARAPDFARTVDIHRKPGYDPCELFLDPRLKLPKVRVAGKLMRKLLGFRSTMNVIPLDTSLVRGSHGRTDGPPERQPVLIVPRDPSSSEETLPCTAVREVILDHLFEDE